MPRVLAIHPGPALFRQRQVRAHQPMLAALGIELVLADDYVDDEDRKLFADVVRIAAPEDVEASLAILERECSARPVHAVLAQSEAGMGVGALLASRIGVRALAPRAALLTTSKHLCRIELERAGVPQPRFALARTSADVRAFAREHGFPLVLKAHASALARLVTLVRDDAGIDPAVARLHALLPESCDVRRLVSLARAARFELGSDPTRDFLVEAFQRGAPVESDGIVFGERIESFGVTEQVITPPPLFFMEGYLLPADRPAHELARVEAVSDAALRALGVTNTGFSIEMRLLEGEAHVIEVNGRLGWDEGFGDLFAAITGGQPAFQALSVALGIDPDVRRRSDVRAAVAYQCSYADEVVTSVPSEAELTALATRHGMQVGLAVHAGQRLHAPPHPDATPHVAWALATHATSSRAAFARAREVADAIDVRRAPIAHD